MNPAQLLAHFNRISVVPDAIPGLRRFILDLAVRGKLVDQDPRDEPAAELLKRIEAKKARLVKEGKIRKQKQFPPIDAGSIPFDAGSIPFPAPKHWAWLPLTGIGFLSGGMTPSKNRRDFWEGDINWFSPKDIKSDELVESELKITSSGVEETGLQLYPPGCLFIVARSGILKRTFPVSISRVEATVNQDLKVLKPFVQGLERYLQIMFRGMTDVILSTLVKTGTTVQSLKYEEFELQPFPLPPLAEQQRIVTKVDELMALCDQLEAAQAERESRRDRLVASSLNRLNNGAGVEAFREHDLFYFNHLPRLTTRPEHIQPLRQTILNLAVRGQLVPQDPSDEPVAELLKSIQAEKARRVKDGSLRQQKPLAPIDEEETDFVLPAGWQWARMANVIKLWNGYAFKSGDFQSKGVPVIRIGDLQGGEIVLSGAVCVSEGIADTAGPEIRIPDGALLIAMSGATTGKVAFNRTGVRILLNQRVGRIEVFLMSTEFIKFFFDTIVARNLSISFGTAIPNLSAQQINETIVPIPPLAEQQRIVAKVDELMGLCNRLEAQLITTQTESRRFLEAVLQKVFNGQDELTQETV